MPASNKHISFATGNRGKILEARIILRPFGIVPRAFDGKGVEVQAESVSEVAAYSARVAAVRCARALIVEDAGLFVGALHGFPGPNSSYVFKKIGIDGLLKLLQGEGSRSAVFRSAVAYCEPEGEPVIFEGVVRGKILHSPVGDGGFGFDPVFVPNGKRKSMAQMTLEEKCDVSHRGEAMRKFGSWFASRP